MSGGELSQHGNLLTAIYAPIAAVSIISFVVSLIAHRGRRDIQAFSVMASTMSNSVYLGIPITVLALGQGGIDAASLVLAVMLPGHHVISILSGEIVVSGSVSLGALRSSAVRAARNPLVLSCLLGTFAALTGLPVPETVLVSSKLIGDMSTGVALIVLGAGLELPDLVPALRNTWPDLIIKLIVHPALVWLSFTLWPVSDTLLRASVLMACTPTAVNTFIVARSLKMNEQYACETVAITTVLAPITIPLWLAFLGLG
jgi:predicted permease